ncbi:transglycosylase domain-containing protein [Streptomyces sp. NPDC007088]|uniref:transglycosylase domain-containing protein n=1 Tax=Streptomyces sp. NPDC007088 TaxID=3364773 RepID=UPI0036BA7C7F
MSEHRRKPPQPQGGGRAAARRARSGASGHRAAPSDNAGAAASHSPGHRDQPAFASRAEARRAGQLGGRRRAPDGGGGHGPGGGRRGGPPKKKFIDYPRAGKAGAGRWIPSWRLVTSMLIAFFGGLVAVAGISYALVDVPDVALSARAQNNVYYWSDGSEMIATGGEQSVNRQIVTGSQIPKSMRYAVISAENKTFETDSGVDPMGIARAVVNMAKGGQTQGGSTITQQYVKNAVLDDQNQTLSRKFKELFISIKVGATVDKDDIMEGYLNTAFYGRGAYGIQAASRAYFDKDAIKLNPSESAFLASLLKGPTYYDPAGVAGSNDPTNTTSAANTARITKRWKWILDEEVNDGHLAKSVRDKYQSLPKTKNPRSNSQLGGQVGYLVDLAKGWVTSHSDQTGITPNMLQQGGYRIYTTFDKKRMKELTRAVEKVQKANINPKLRPEKDTHVQFGGASVDPKSGAIIAIYGGRDATQHYTNNADVTGAQVGSTFKPFVLAAAMQDGKRDPKLPETQTEAQRTRISPMSIYSGKNKLKIKKYDGSVWTDKKGNEWRQTNDGGEDYHPENHYQLTLREAMQWSVNSAYVQLGMDVGLDKVKNAAIAAGIEDREGIYASNNYPSFSLGTSSPSAIRMAGAYGTFANSGLQNDPYSVTKIEDEKGVKFKHKAAAKRAFEPEVADNVTDVLKNVVEKGTGTAAKLDDRPAAGKTGTTDGNKSAWFVGYTPQLSTAISMFRLDDNEKNKTRKFEEMYGTGGQKQIHGASFPSEIWHDYMTQALADTEVENFPAAKPIGEIVKTVATPPPPPSAPPSPSSTPSGSPSASHSPSTPPPSPSTPPASPTESCKPFDFNCHSDGGNEGGDQGGDQGADGGQEPPPSETPTTPQPPGQEDPGGGENGWNPFGD